MTDEGGARRRQTLQYRVEAHVATVTLDRPEVLNAFNRQMRIEFDHVWKQIRDDDEVRVVVLRANGERAFSSGLDTSEPADESDPFAGDLTAPLSPKRAQVYKPLICAVQGIAAGGAFAWLNDADILICSEDAVFFDPHLDVGLVTSHTALGLVRTGVPLREALRISLLGLDERMSAQRALEIGLASEVLPRERLWPRAAELAELIAAKPPTAVQASVRAIWTARDLDAETARELGLRASREHNPTARLELAAEPRTRRGWALR